MKKLIFIFWLLFTAGPVFSQVLSYSTVEYFTADSVVYMLENDKATMRIANASNEKMDSLHVYKDGRFADGTWDDYPSGELHVEEFLRAINETFSTSEIELLKSSRTAVGVFCVFDSTERLVECSFILAMTPAAMSLPLERFATLERKLKQYVTTDITYENTKKLKYVGNYAEVNLWR